MNDPSAADAFNLIDAGPASFDLGEFAPKDDISGRSPVDVDALRIHLAMLRHTLPLLPGTEMRARGGTQQKQFSQAFYLAPSLLRQSRSLTAYAACASLPFCGPESSDPAFPPPCRQPVKHDRRMLPRVRRHPSRRATRVGSRSLRTSCARERQLTPAHIPRPHSDHLLHEEREP